MRLPFITALSCLKHLQVQDIASLAALTLFLVALGGWLPELANLPLTIAKEIR